MRDRCSINKNGYLSPLHLVIASSPVKNNSLLISSPHSSVPLGASIDDPSGPDFAP